ncbi:MAG: ankyrin repeat domain-containing protein [Planctomycetota bacterium]
MLDGGLGKFSTFRPFFDFHGLNNQLEKAIFSNDARRAKVILRRGAKVDAWNGELLHLAARKGDLVAVDLLLRLGASVSIEDELGQTALYDASRSGHTEIAEMLLQAGATVDAKDRDGYTPLNHAAWTGQTEVAQLLIAKGARPTFHDAAALGQTHQLAEFVSSGTDVNTKTPQGLTALHLAAGNGYVETVALLLDRGAATEAVATENRWTPLHWAVYCNHKDIVQLLVERNANVNAKDVTGRTPLDVARQNGNDDIAEILRTHQRETTVIDN